MILCEDRLQLIKDVCYKLHESPNKTCKINEIKMVSQE